MIRTVIGIVGSEAAKFTPETEAKAKDIIRKISAPFTTICSGHCHLGGVDIYAEDIADELGKDKLIFAPKNLDWSTGYKPRNIQIARASDEIYCITVKSLPPTYKGMRFSHCYHCNTNDHIKSGGCWTVKYAKNLGRLVARVIVIE